MGKTISIIALSLIMVSCLKTNGVLKVKNTLNFNTNIKKLKLVLPAGHHNATVTFKEEIVKITIPSGAVKLVKRMNGKIANNPFATKEIKFTVPKGMKLPSNGTMTLPAKLSGQPYDVVGHVSTEYSRSGSHHGSESCSWTTHETVCEPVCEIIIGRHGHETRVCHRECYDRTITHHGHQEVEYHYDYTDKDFEIFLTNPGNKSAKQARFTGTWHDSDKVYDYKGSCY